MDDGDLDFSPSRDQGESWKKTIIQVWICYMAYYKKAFKFFILLDKYAAEYVCFVPLRIFI